MICSFIVMKCEGFSMISDLVDYLANNLLIAHYCGFDISRPLPSYWTFDRFLKNFDNDFLSDIMKSQVLLLAEKGIVDTSFIGLDSTPISANTSQNNPKSFVSKKFKPDNQPSADTDCKLGVHTAPALKTPDKNGCGYGTRHPLQTLIPLHISVCWLLLSPPSLCRQANPTGN